MKLSYIFLTSVVITSFSCFGLANQFSESSLIKDFELAQKTYHEGNLEESRDQFLYLIKKYKSENLSPPTMELLHYAHLRSAQLTSNGSLRKKLLQKAWNYSEFSHIDMEIFPPPLVLEYLSLKKKLKPKAHGISNRDDLGLAETSPEKQSGGQNKGHQKSILKKNWFYWGLGAIGVLVGYSVYKHNKSQTPAENKEKTRSQTIISF